MAENTPQYQWIVLLTENLDAIRDDFVAGDLFWYPVEGSNTKRYAPDVLVAPGRPKGHRGSYKQWEENGEPPAVVMEVLSPGNSAREMMRKESFYAAHGVSEFVVVDPENETGWAYRYADNRRIDLVEDIAGWTSPLLGIRFERVDGRLVVFGPDGLRFERLPEARTAWQEAMARESQRAEQETERADKLAARLRELGVDPDSF